VRFGTVIRGANEGNLNLFDFDRGNDHSFGPIPILDSDAGEVVHDRWQ
jgi:hypothetical protein